jgi:fucose permease
VGAVLVVAALSRTVPLLFVSLVAAGALQGILAITGNVEADRMETVLDRQVLVRAHGFYSLGTVLAGAMGIAFRTWGIEPWLHLALILPLATAMSCVATWGMDTLPARADETAEKPGKVVRPSLAVIMLFLAGGASLYLDNAGSDWSVILLRDGYDAGVTIATMAVAIWALGQTVGRLSYPLVAGMLDSTWLPILMVSFAAVGLGLVVLAAHAALAMAGLLLMGLGTSVLFPMAISAAARLADRSSAANVASLSQLAFLAGIATPIVLGALVQAAGIRGAFASGTLVLASSLVVLVLYRPFAVPGDQRADLTGRRLLVGAEPKAHGFTPRTSSLRLRSSVEDRKSAIK